MAQYSKDSLKSFNEYMPCLLSFCNIASVSADLKISSKAKMPEFGNVSNFFSRFISVYNTLLRKTLSETTWSPTDNITFDVNYSVATNASQRRFFSNLDNLRTIVSVILSRKCTIDYVPFRLNGHQIDYLYKMFANFYVSAEERRTRRLTVPYGTEYTAGSIAARITNNDWYAYLIDNSEIADRLVDEYATTAYYGNSHTDRVITPFMFSDEILNDVRTRLNMPAHPSIGITPSLYTRRPLNVQHSFTGYLEYIKTSSIPIGDGSSLFNVDNQNRSFYAAQLFNHELTPNVFLENLKASNFVPVQNFLGDWPARYWGTISSLPTKVKTFIVSRIEIANTPACLLFSNYPIDNLNQLVYQTGFNANVGFNNVIGLNKNALIEFLDFFKNIMAVLPSHLYVPRPEPVLTVNDPD